MKMFPDMRISEIKGEKKNRQNEQVDEKKS